MIKDLIQYLDNKKILILGFGRVAKTLAQRLKGMSKYITCASIKTEELAWIDALGYEKIDLDDLSKSQDLLKSLANYNVIINRLGA